MADYTVLYYEQNPEVLPQYDAGKADHLMMYAFMICP